MKYDFDRIHPRGHTDSIKWDYFYEGGALKRRETGVDPLVPEELLPMWLADMDFPAAAPVIEALERCARQGIFGYTRPGRRYYAAIARWHWDRFRWRVDHDWILTTSGVMPTINLLIQTFTEPGDKVIIQPPVFDPFFRAAEYNGRAVAANPLRLQDGVYFMDFDDLEAKTADPRARMIVLCSPHNPVGRVWRREELERLGEICERNDLLIVSDEIHSGLVYSWAAFTTFGVVDERFNDRLVVCNGPSKTFNLPGLKIANAIIPSEALRERFLISLRNLNELFGFSAFRVAALQAAYEAGGEWLAQLMAYLEANYLYLREYLEAHCPQLGVVHPGALYLVWIDCRALGLDPAGLRALFFDEAKVYLEEGSGYGAEGAGFIRLNIACPRALLSEALARIRRAVQRVKPGEAARG